MLGADQDLALVKVSDTSDLVAAQLGDSGGYGGSGGSGSSGGWGPFGSLNGSDQYGSQY